MAATIKWYGDKYNKGLYTEVDRIMENLAERTKSRIQQFCPVRSGKLKNSISISKNKQMDYNVSSDKEYAKYVEYGTSSMPARPFFRTAINSVRGI